MEKKIEEYGDVLSPKDVHDILGIGYNNTYALLASNAIKNFRIGRHRRILKKALLDYIEKAQSEN